mmetsp:Transcript_5135/g.13518  ORF Transcript_5135/g.13518 Transcript_5135/m.13518 type:complete len:781 (-) Transcript_5135:912-3254(-)
MWRHARLSVLGGVVTTATAATFIGRAHCASIDLDNASLQSLRLSVSSAIQQAKPPVARREPHTVYFGINPNDEGENRGAAPMTPPLELVDDLFWIRDDERKSEEVLELLHAENAYTDLKMAHLESFREILYAEMLSHVQEDDDEYPVPAADGYEYWARTVKGKSFKQYLRRKIGTVMETAQVFLDVNIVPSLPFFTSNANWDAKQCDVQSIKPSPSGAMLAYCVDGSGYETYHVRLKDLASGAELDETITDMAGSIAWAGDKTLFYTRHDKAHRPFQVWRHSIGSTQVTDQLVFEDRDELFWVGVSSSRDGSLVFIESESKETMEAHFVPSASPTDPPKVVRPREFGVKYDVESHAPSRSLFLTSNIDGKRNRELFRASLDAPSVWHPVTAPSGPVLAHSTDRSLDYVQVFDGFLAATGRSGGFTKIWLVPLGGDGRATGDATAMAFDEEACECHVASNKLFTTGGKLRVDYTSMTTPPSLLEYDLASGGYELLKRKPVPNYDASKYATRQMRVTARDGETIPITLFWRPDAIEGGEGAAAPVHLYGYGSYGVCIDPGFGESLPNLPLVDRGVVYAIAHVRGGGEMGHHAWYEAAGKYLHKRNTFDDFVDCAHALLAEGVAQSGRITCEGRSAGGLLVGNVVNDAPELFKAALAGVPFVDLMVTMCDPTIPLTCEEWEEWGNPNEAKYYDYMREYSPIDNVVEGANYPGLLIVSGLNDPRVAYWEPTKWAQVLRSKVANGDDVLLKMDLAAGHFSASDRYRYLRELAFDYAWLLDKLGKA